jgi:NAD(P)-dependent dehydrogenase (short-subunit alcohol dehydrogenase family)
MFDPIRPPLALESPTMAQGVLITGCSSGIGRATAERLAGHGFTVYATARDVASIADLEARGFRLLALDVTDEESMRTAVETVTAEQGALHALVNNADYSQSGAIEEVPIADVRRQFETNVFGLPDGMWDRFLATQFPRPGDG